MKRRTGDRKSERRNSSVLKKIYTLCFCMLVVCFSYAVWFNFYISDINDSSNTQRINTEFDALMHEIGEQLGNVNNIEYSLQSDASTATIYSIHMAGSKAQRQTYIKKLIEKLDDYQSAYSDILGLYVALPEVDLVIGRDGQRSVSTFRNEHMCAELDRVLADSAAGESGILIGKGTSLYATEALPSVAYHYKRNNSYSVTIVALSREYLDNWLARRCEGKNMDVYMLTQNGDIYAQYASGGKLTANEAQVLFERGDGAMQLGSENCDALTGNAGRLRVVALFGRNPLSAIMASNRRALVLMGISFVLIALVLYAAIKRWFYTPLQGILNEYDVENDSNADEYMRLGRFMKDMHMNLRSMEVRISENEQNARRITSDALNAMSWEQSRAFMDESQRFCVFTLTMEDKNGTFLMSDCRKFCLALGEIFKVNMVYDRTDVCTGVIGYDDDERLLNAIGRLLEERTGKGFVRMGVSRGHRDAQHIAVAHEECYSAFFSNDAHELVVFSPDEAICNRYFTVSLAQQATLASCVSAGNAGDVEICLNEIYSDNEGVDNFWRLRLSGFLLDLLAILASNHDLAVDDVFDSKAAWTRTHNAALLTSRVYSAYKRLAGMLGGRHDSVVDAIKLYVDEHIGDDLSLSDAAQYVNRSYNYISMRFSEVTGVMFSEYVQKRRISRACELLCQTERSVADIADSVGYRIPSSFIRLFKREMGMTPGQYRENCGKRKSDCDAQKL